MRARRWHVLSLIAIVTASLAVAAGPAGEPVTPADRALIMKELQLDAADLDPKEGLDVTKIDLNDDKRPDFVVMAPNSGYCGSGGCSAWALMSDGTGYRTVAEVLGFGLTVAETRTKGVRDLAFVGRGADGPIRLQWDGKKYERAPQGK